MRAPTCYILLTHYYSSAIDTILLAYKNRLTNEHYIQTAKTVFFNDELLLQFSASDAACIKYFAGY